MDCSVESCPNKGRAKGWCKKHYMLWYRHGTTDKKYVKAKRRFYDKFIPEPNSGCWLWLDATECNGGYGRIRDHCATKAAHRFSYELHRGAIPEGMLVCHRCDTPSCVNPDHLFLGTSQDNVTDSVNKGRHTRGVIQALAKLNDQSALEIFESSEPFDVLAERYHVSAWTVSDIKRGTKWKHATQQLGVNNGLG